MNAIALAETIARLFANLPLLERIDLIVADAEARGLRVTGVVLGAADFETFEREAATHMMVSVCEDSGTYRDHAVRRQAVGDSWVEFAMADGARTTLPISPESSERSR